MFCSTPEEFAYYYVQCGLYGPEEVANLVVEVAGGGSVSDGQLRVLAAREVQRKQKREAAYPAQTDCDRLTQAFRHLPSLGIMGVEFAGYDHSDSQDLLEKIAYAWHLQGALERLRGCCYYTHADVWNAITENHLFLHFTARSDDYMALTGVANTVVEALRTQGLCPVWSGDLSGAIKLPITWQRRAGPPASPEPPSFIDLPSTSPLSIKQERFDAITVVTLTGELLEKTKSKVLKECEDLTGKCVFDLQGLTSTDEEGLASFISLTKNLRGKAHFVLYSEDEALHRFFQMTGWGAVIKLLRSRELALGELLG